MPTTEDPSVVDEVSPEEVREKLSESDVQIVDIRNRAAFARGHIPGAINLPLQELPQRVDDIDWGREVVFVCPIGQSSVQAARLLRSFEGVDDDVRVASMAGGYDQWDSELETGSGNADDPD